MECRLSSSSDPWSCQVTIRWEFEPSGKRMHSIDRQVFGPRITDKRDVEMRLRQAQAAVLNPKTPANQFLHKKEEDLKNFVSTNPSISMNVVSVELEGPDLVDLAFVDLPGIIAP
jgi:hypothetical protein